MFKIKAVIICVILMSSFFFSNVTKANEIESISLSAKSATLFCVDNEKFIFDKNGDMSLSMASTTKIMTTLLALEQAEIENEIVTFTSDMYAEGSSMYLEEGNKVYLEDLAKGMMSASGNDAANAVALTLADTFEDFSILMNNKAQEIEMYDTNFVTPSGLDDDNHYSTANDMALLMAYAMQNDDFAQITNQKTVRVDFIEPTGKTSVYQNHNKLLSLYEFCVGGKTGFTQKSGRCLVSCAIKDGITLVAVTLNASDDWNDHIKMYEYGFSKLENVALTPDNNFNIPIVGSYENSTDLYTQLGTSAVVFKDEIHNIESKVLLPQFLYAPLSSNEVVGEIIYTLDDEIIATNEIKVLKNAEYKEINKNIFEIIGDFFINIFT